MPEPVSTAPPDGELGPRRVILCNACGRGEDCSAEQLLRYTREGWPRCCGHVMAFYTEPSSPDPAPACVDAPPAPAE